jgi:type IV pilus assembly protein PilM
MAVQPGYWGIDIGQCALKAIRLQIIDNKLTATAFDYVEHPKILSQSDADPEQLTREALEKFLSRNPIKGDKVAIGVAGQSGLARFVKLPPVEEKKIEDIVKFEAKQQIPFPLDEVVWDYQKVSEGAVEGGFAIDTEIGLFAMKRDMISRVLNHFSSVNIEVHTIQMSPLALCSYITYDMLNRGGPDAPSEAPPTPAPGTKRKCIVALDVGTDGSNLIITDAGKIIWQRPIPIGGNHFTRALIKELKLTFAKAEHLKRNAAKSPELANILRALKPVLTDFVGEVQRSLGYFTNTHRDAQVEYMVGVGSAFKLPGLQKYLGDKLQLRVEKPTKFLRLTGEAVTDAPVFVDNLLTFPVAYGLALQALGVARLKTNLLPPEISWDRKIRAKKPWAAAAAACLLLGTFIWTLGYTAPYSAANDPKIPAAIEKTKKINDEAASVVKQIDVKKKEVEVKVQGVEAIIAGNDERFNLLRLHEFINSCLPIPGKNGNMNEPHQAKYWTSTDGIGGGAMAATAKYFDRIRKGVDPKIAIMDDDMRQYLATLDIEAVNCRYTTDLRGFFQNAKNYCRDYVGTLFDGMDEKQRADLVADPPNYPDGKGWIVEIRGTTWYNQGTLKGPELLRETLLYNLKEKSKRTQDPAIKDRISHIFLYNCTQWKDEDPKPDRYYFIYTSLINFLIPDALQSASATANAPAPAPTTTVRGPAPKAQGPLRYWRGLSKGEVGVAASTASDSGASTSAGGNPYTQRTIPKPTAPAASGAEGAKAPDKKLPNKKPRHEFVILFVWKENTPSDAYLPPAPPPPATPAK